MAGDLVITKALSPTMSPKDVGGAAMQWVCTRRGRMIALTFILCTIWLGLMGMGTHEALSSRYHGMSSYYPWRPYLSSLPEIMYSSFKTPSNLTLQLENGQIDHVPAKLKKTTPNFHLIMPSERDTNDFCKTTLSAMVLDYPPPTVVQLRSSHQASKRRQEGILSDTLHYLSNTKLVKDQDLVLIVDAQQTWFQLPSDVIVAQYKRLLEDGNLRLLKRYGTDEQGFQRFNQTIVFGAEKMCEGDAMVCRYVPLSVFPDNLYGTETGRRISETPAKFINSRFAMGPAKDLRTLYEAAQKKFEDGKSESQTVQSVMATLFAEQQLSRDAVEVETKSSSAKIKDFISGELSKSAAKHRLDHAQAELSNFTKQEFSIGLDYTHTLFQPLVYSTQDELVAIVHNSSTNLTQHSHLGPDTQFLSLPTALINTKPPFSRPDYTKNDPSANEYPAYIDNLEYDLRLDRLPDRTVPWTAVPLVQNTYTGAIPGMLIAAPSSADQNAPSANITWDTLWYAKHKRALLRNYFRAAQSPSGYHDSAVGGDRNWDVRGGRGGVWTAVEQVWLPWGEVDGVCGTVNELNAVFADGRGVWLHEMEAVGEKNRIDLMRKFRAGKAVHKRRRRRRRKRWDVEEECVRYC